MEQSDAQFGSKKTQERLNKQESCFFKSERVHSDLKIKNKLEERMKEECLLVITAPSQTTHHFICGFGIFNPFSRPSVYTKTIVHPWIPVRSKLFDFSLISVVRFFSVVLELVVIQN